MEFIFAITFELNVFEHLQKYISVLFLIYK